jgi:hypothetical protein
MLGRDEEQGREGRTRRMLGKDTEQWEQVVRNSGTRNIVMEGQGTVVGMEKEQKEWRDKEQCEGGTRNSGREGQGTVSGRETEQRIGGTGSSLMDEQRIA